MKKTVLALVLVLGCSRESNVSAADAPKSAAPAALQHHEVRVDRLPPPYATKSGVNAPGTLKKPAGAKITLPPRFSIAVWADGLDNPRNMIQAPNGDVLLAETGAGRIRVLRDTNGDTIPDQRFTWAEGLDGPFGLAIAGNALYVGEESQLVRYDYTPGDTKVRGAPRVIAKLPSGGHSTRNVIAKGKKLYVATGSLSNVSDETSDPRRAAIQEMNLDGSGAHVFASGVRNPVGLAWNPASGALWTAVNERDGLGDELVPDYITDVRPGAFYGWPFSYLGQHPDPRRKGEHPELVAKAIVPSVLFQAHSAPLGLTFYDGKMFPPQYRGGAFVAFHGSWNRADRTGYKVVFVPFRGGAPAGGYDDFAIGWDTPAGFWGRPVGVLALRDGSLLIADDGGDLIWRVTYK